MASPLTFEIDIDEMTSFVHQFMQGRSAFEGIQRNAMLKSVAVIEGAVRAETPVNVGTTRAAWQSQVRGAGPDLVGRVFNPAEWAIPLEVGRKPGKMPPVDAIQYWVERKGLAQGEDSRQVAFLIARAIGRRGTEGAHMAERGMANATPAVVKIWRGANGQFREALT